MLLRRMHLVGLGLAILAVTLGAGFASDTADPATPAASVQSLMWSSDLPGTYTHPGAIQFAAAHEEGGFTDWRLPTLTELQSAVTDADPDTFGQTAYPSSSTWYWSSKKQGNMWAFAVEVVTDANGYPIPSLSGRVIKTTQPSWHLVRCVRP